MLALDVGRQIDVLSAFDKSTIDFAITNDVLIELIKTTEQPDVLNVRMLMEEEEDMEENSSDSD